MTLLPPHVVRIRVRRSSGWQTGVADCGKKPHQPEAAILASAMCDYAQRWATDSQDLGTWNEPVSLQCDRGRHHPGGAGDSPPQIRSAASLHPAQTPRCRLYSSNALVNASAVPGKYLGAWTLQDFTVPHRKRWDETGLFQAFRQCCFRGRHVGKKTPRASVRWGVIKLWTPFFFSITLRETIKKGKRPAESLPRPPSSPLAEEDMTLVVHILAGIWQESGRHTLPALPVLRRYPRPRQSGCSRS
jgi:hypothetical protein